MSYAASANLPTKAEVILLTEKAKLGFMDKLHLFRRDAKLYIASVTASSFANGMSGVIFNLYLLEAGYHEDFIGYFLSISLFATAGVALLAGMVTDRTARKIIIVVAGAVSFVSVVLQYNTLDPFYLVASQVFLGASSAFTQVAVSPYLTDLSTEVERTYLFGFGSGMGQLTVLFGNLSGGALPTIMLVLFGPGYRLLDAYKLTLWISLIPLLLSIVLFLPMTRDRSPERKSHFGLSNVKHWPFIGRYTFTVGTVGLGAGMIVMFFSLYFKTEFGASAELIGLIFAINTAVLASGSFSQPRWLIGLGKSEQWSLQK